MTSVVEEKFSDPETAQQCIREAWELMGLRTTTFEMATSILSTLSLCYLYCPDNMKDNVEAAMINTELRMKHIPPKEGIKA